MQVYAAANLQKRGLKPELLYNRSTGYGVVTFHKKTREITLECYPRYVNPQDHPEGQYEGWPLTIHQKENFDPADTLSLPTLIVKGLDDPVIKIHMQSNGELIQVLRIKGNLDISPG